MNNKKNLIQSIIDRFNIAMMMVLLMYQKNDMYENNKIFMTSLEVDFIVGKIKKAKHLTVNGDIEDENKKSIIVETIKLCDHLADNIQQNKEEKSICSINTLLEQYRNIIKCSTVYSCMHDKQEIEEIMRDIEIMNIMDEVVEIASVFGVNLYDEFSFSLTEKEGRGIL